MNVTIEHLFTLSESLFFLNQFDKSLMSFCCAKGTSIESIVLKSLKSSANRRQFTCDTQLDKLSMKIVHKNGPRFTTFTTKTSYIYL